MRSDTVGGDEVEMIRPGEAGTGLSADQSEWDAKMAASRAAVAARLAELLEET